MRAMDPAPPRCESVTIAVDDQEYAPVAGLGELREALYAAAPGVFFHHSGHTPRNQRTSSPVATGVEFLEVAATKEYPGGFALLKVYEGGYLLNFYKSSSTLARQWSQTTSGEYLGLYPAYTLGTAADRNHVVSRDFRSLRGVQPTGLPSADPLTPSGPLSLTGI